MENKTSFHNKEIPISLYDDGWLVFWNMNKRVKLKRLFLIGFIASTVFGNIYYAWADNENMKFQLRPYVDKPVNSEENTGDEMPADITDADADPISTPAEPAPTQASPVQASPSKILRGQVVYTVPSGTPIKLKLACVPSHPMQIMNRDLDGNLYPARLGQTITARTSEDIYVEKNKIIPEGTIFSGKVSEILPPRRVGRPGSLVLSFDELITPDGRKFAFEARADNHRASTMKTKAKGFGIIAAHAAGGAVVGALVAYQVFGLEKTIALHGYNIAGGAAAGALIATGYAIMRKGPKATLEPGDDLNMTINEDLLMPIATAAPVKNKALPSDVGLTIQIEKSKIVNDGLGGQFITVDVTAINDGDEDLSSIDLFLEDTNKDRHPLCSSPDENSQFLFHLEPHSKQHLHLSFLTPYPKLKQQLVWLDHETKIVLAEQNL